MIKMGWDEFRNGNGWRKHRGQVFILDRYAVKKREDGRGMTIDDGRRTKGRGMIASGKADSLREWMDQ